MGQTRDSNAGGFILQIFKEIVKSQYSGDFESALTDFDRIVEEKIRPEYEEWYVEQHPNASKRSIDQSWRTAVGKAYELVVMEFLSDIVSRIDGEFDQDVSFEIVSWRDLPAPCKEKIKLSAKVGSESLVVYPDADIVLIARRDGDCDVLCIFSCKTSLRERLKETAFWKRELEHHGINVPLVFITTNKDDELRYSTNRYITAYVLDATFVTGSKRNLQSNAFPAKVLESYLRQICDAYLKKENRLFNWHTWLALL